MVKEIVLIICGTIILLALIIKCTILLVNESENNIKKENLKSEKDFVDNIIKPQKDFQQIHYHNCNFFEKNIKTNSDNVNLSKNCEKQVENMSENENQQIDSKETESGDNVDTPPDGTK